MLKMLTNSHLSFSSWILGVELEEKQASLDVLKSAECIYSVEVFHVKSLSPCLKDDLLYFLHLILM